MKLYRLTEVTPPLPVLAPGRYVLARGNECSLMIRLFYSTRLSELADMVEAAERSAAA